MALQQCKELPPGFETIKDVLDGKCSAGRLVDVIGLVTDFRAPVETKGTDWKCQIRLYDQSVEDSVEDSLLLNVFRAESDMPTARCGDVIMIFKAKAFVSHLYHAINKERVPSVDHFEAMSVRSVNIKNKFRELTDVREHNFVNTVAQLVREPYDLGDKITLWVSDYTENHSFYHFSFSGGKDESGRVGDPYGYLDKYSTNRQKPDWTGPFGKRSMQITCFEPHTTAIREQKISNGSWVDLRNVQIKFGHNASNLEGFLRGEGLAPSQKLNIHLLDPTEDPESISPQLKNAIRRKRDYEKLKKSQLKEISEAAAAGLKRKQGLELDSGKPKKPNSKARRAAARAASHAKRTSSEANTSSLSVAIPDLNTQGDFFILFRCSKISPLTKTVKCEHGGKGTSFVAEMMELVYQDTTINGAPVKLQLPFINANFRTNVRVVDFMPSDLRGFSRPKRKKKAEFQCLSDQSESGTDTETDEEISMQSDAATDWEWRFYLQLEDAVAPHGQQKNRFWVFVDDQAAQCMVDLDAADLTVDQERLALLQQRMFILWGDLEEYKSRLEKRAKAAGQAPEDSDEEHKGGHDGSPFSNRPFSCCIRQYGVKCIEQKACRADAGEGRRWQRMFALFGTKIATS
ncbi:hypothetical protein RJ55_00242 [Drechmeria coniospora]|nr:hypothetical protein RJ55_00242 [Drechmeria coniospora]